RWLEMMGSIFWSAEYCFMENPSLDTMIANMQLVQPTIFISIPKKWIQLFEFISDNVDLEMDEQDKISDAVKATTGGMLKWGLSAAGYLSPDIFRFFQTYGIELMSGFGMTEATGGITMTPPGKYKENSLGKALPGIKVKLADDGEILIKGHYVMMGYFGTGREETFTNDEWLPTGDIMKMDDDGFIEIVDRKKEIYKNIKGETIAPQKIENYFNEFDSVKQVFLVGDHKPFNTALIYPDYESENVPLKEMSEQQKQEYFSSLVVTVNKFLAPFERIVDFRIIDREFSAGEGELTLKGTYKRNVIDKNFSDLISTMYKRSYINIAAGNAKIRIPTWFLREKGSLNRDILPKDDGIKIPKIHSSLTIKKTSGEQNLFRIGSFVYKIDSRFVDMQTFFTNPFYWLGNKELLDFTGEAIFQWYRQNIAQVNLQYHSTAGSLPSENKLKEELQKIYINGEISLNGLHLSALLLQSENTDDHAIAISFLQKILSDDTTHHYKLALEITLRPNLTQLLDTRRSLFKAAAQKLKQDKFEKIFEQYLKLNYNFINKGIIDYLVETRRGEEIPDVVEHLLKSEIEKPGAQKPFNETPVASLLDLLEAYSINHPTSFKRVRRFIMRYAVFSDSEELKQKAEKTLNNLKAGLREWLGKNQTVAVDMETGDEYGWEDVLTFEDGIDAEDRLRMKNALIKTSVLREAIFLFSKSVLLRLDNILPGGVWVSHLETKPYKSIYRVTLQTRFQGAFEITIHLARNLPPAHIQEEIKWLILPATTITGERLLPKFGGYWDEYELWTEEFVPRESVKKFIQKTVRTSEDAQLQRLYYLWPYFVWNAAAAYMNFWKLTNYKIELANPLPENISIPTHDYQTGTLLYSVSKRIKSDSVADFFKNFYMLFVKETVDKYPFLEKKSIWNYIFSGVMEVGGEAKGIKLLKQFRVELKTGSFFPDKEIVLERTNLFIRNIQLNGYIPKSLFFAIKRFHRWFELNKDAAFTAQAEMLYELYETYHLFKLEESHTSTRTVFFMETAFIDSQETFKNALREIAHKQHTGSITKDETLYLI
ncbi:MAG TPA: hypothetical protein ENH47_02290, partial [Ignavibacteriales bacterium]|nr:hypothetical protein [Ignavibacteriales bacterium]